MNAQQNDTDRFAALLPGPLTSHDSQGPAARPVPAREFLEKIHPGRRGERLRIDGEIARGGMGAVLRAYDGELRRWLAMKVVLQGGDSARSGAAARRESRFLAEAQITGQLDHPGIVPLYEIGEHAEHGIYYTMRLVSGEPLSRVFEWCAEGRVDWPQTRCLDVLLRVCDAVGYAHERHVVHRDLKPANIMVGRHGEVYVMDWGLARVLEQPTATGATSSVTSDRDEARSESGPGSFATVEGEAVGTPCYMAPEQAFGRLAELGPPTDVYAVGAMLYQLLAGHKPYAAHGKHSDPADVLRKLQAGPPDELRDLAPDCPSDLVAICEKAMARKTSERYATMTALSEDIRAFVEGRVVRTFEAGAFAEIRKWTGRNKLAAVALLVALITLVGGVTIGALAVAQELEQRERRAVRTVLHEVDTLRQTSPDGVPSRSSATDWWLRRAQRLVRGGSDGNAGLRSYERQLESLAKSALTAAASEVSDWTRIDALTLKRKRAERDWYARMLSHERWPSAAEVEKDFASLRLPDDVHGLNRLAFKLINPDRQREYGRERHAVKLAQLVVENLGRSAAPCSDPDQCRSRAACLDTLAWTLCRVGEFDRARVEQERALRHAREFVTACLDRGPAVQRDARDLLHSLEDNQRLLEREAHCWRSGEEARRYAGLLAEIEALEHRSESPKASFRDPMTELWHRQLRRVVRALRALQQRIAVARAAASDGDAAKRWRAAIDAIFADSRFGRRISTQRFLYPLGADPESGLQEFAYLPSGFAPTRAADGRLRLTRNSAIVFVLIPGAGDVDPMFFGKHEVTNAQWSRLVGGWPLASRDTQSCEPCTHVSWEEAFRATQGTWLRLPSQAEWRHACRAGRAPNWHAKADSASLRSETVALPQTRLHFRKVDEGPPNPFGLHELVGNVYEWCRDLSEAPSPLGFEVQFDTRVFMGASVSTELGGVAKRIEEGESRVSTFEGRHLGVRLVRPLTP